MVERSRIHLPDAGENICEAQEFGDPAFQVGQPGGVPVEQVEHVLRGAHRALDAAQRVPVDQLGQPGQRDQRLLGGRREPLAQRRGLRGDVVAAAGHHQIAVQRRPLGQPRDHRDAVGVDEFQGAPDLQLLDVLGEVAARHALVHVLVAGQRVELLDAGLDVVARDPFARGDRGQVDLLEHPLVVGDHAVGHRHAQFGLRTEHGDPQSSFGDDLGFRRPDRHHLVAGVPVGQDIRNRHEYTAYGTGKRPFMSKAR